MSRLLFALALVVVCSLHTVLGAGTDGSRGGGQGQGGQGQGQGGMGQGGGRPSSDASCLMKCMAAHAQQSPGSSAMPMVNIQKVKTENATTMCPQVDKNQTQNMDATCAAMKHLMNCTDGCPDSPIKAMTMTAFKSQQFICVDRLEDFKKNMPCLSDTCPDMERACQPKCGSLEEKSKKVITLIQRIQGSGPPPVPAPPGTNVSPPPPGKDVDTSAIMKAIAEICTAISCFMTCGEPIVTKQCGKDAYSFYRDFTWNMFTSVAQGMSSVGLQTQWPDECKALQSGNNTGTSAPDAGTTVVVVPGPVANGTEAPGPVATVPPTVGNGTQAPAAATGASTTVIPSIALLLATIFLAIA